MSNWTFGDVLWSMVVFFFWFMFIWMFIAIFSDIFRRDLSGWSKAGWIILIVVLPFLGILIYLIVRPKDEPCTNDTPSLSSRYIPTSPSSASTLPFGVVLPIRPLQLT